MRRLMLAAAALLIVAAVALVLVMRHDNSPLALARDRVADDDGWRTSADAAETLAAIGEDLLRAGTSCGRGARCDALLSASGWAQVAAVRIIPCTRAAIFQTRADTEILVTTLRSRASTVAPLPRVPRC